MDRLRRRPRPEIKSNPQAPSPSQTTSHGLRTSISTTPRLVVASVKVVVALLLPGVTLTGLNVHVVSAGSPEHENVTAEFHGAGFGWMMIV